MKGERGSRPDRVLPEEGLVSSFVKLAGSKGHHGRGRSFLARLKPEPVELEEKHADDEPDALVAIHKRAVSDNPERESGCKPHDIGLWFIPGDLTRPGQGRVKKRRIADTLGPAMELKRRS